MPENNSNKDVGKKIAAEEALNFVHSEMVIGLGTGSTAKIFVDLLSQKYFKENLNIKVLATSSSTELQSKSLGLPITSIESVNYVDLTIDGADEVDSDLNLLKGGGGALLQEKIVASYSKKMIVIVDNSKVVDNLGKFPLPIEIVKFGSKCTQKKIENTQKYQKLTKNKLSFTSLCFCYCFLVFYIKKSLEFRSQSILMRPEI